VAIAPAVFSAGLFAFSVRSIALPGAPGFIMAHLHFTPED